VPPRVMAAAANDRGMLVLEQKLSILTQGPSRTRRNPALDVLTGRVPDERLQSLQANLLSLREAAPTAPTAMVLPVAAIRMAAVARSARPAPSPWLKPTSSEQPRLRLITPPPSRWSRVPWLGPWLERLMGERRSYTWPAHNPRAHLAS
jgi:hypothetical protein